MTYMREERLDTGRDCSVHGNVAGLSAICSGMRASGRRGYDGGAARHSQEDGEGLDQGRARVRPKTFSTELLLHLIILSLVLAFGVLRQAQPNLRHVVQYGLRSRLAKVICEVQTLCRVLSILFRSSHRRCQYSASANRLGLWRGTRPEGGGTGPIMSALLD